MFFILQSGNYYYIANDPGGVHNLQHKLGTIKFGAWIYSSRPGGGCVTATNAGSCVNQVPTLQPDPIPPVSVSASTGMWQWNACFCFSF